MSELCLVTGGGGFLGRFIVEQLLASGRRVRIFSRGAYPQLPLPEFRWCGVICEMPWR